jgi:hypothetical protein
MVAAVAAAQGCAQHGVTLMATNQPHCPRPQCQTTLGCICGTEQWWPGWVQPFQQQILSFAPMQSLPVNLPVSFFGQVTIAIMESDGSLTIKVNQPRPIEDPLVARPVKS